MSRCLVDRPLISFHFYERDRHSGAGNCWCGHPVASSLHPHSMRASMLRSERCVCGFLADHYSHTRTPGDKP